MMFGLTRGLQFKSLVGLLLVGLVVLCPTYWIGFKVLDNLQRRFSVSFASYLTRLDQEEITSLLARELAVAKQTAKSPLLNHWLERSHGQPTDMEPLISFMQRNSEGFTDRDVFVASAESRKYYFFNRKNPDAVEVLSLSESNPAAQWFFSLMRSSNQPNINVAYRQNVQQTTVWVNVPMFADGRKTGWMGTGLNLANFLRTFVRHKELGITSYVLNAQAAPPAYVNPGMVIYRSDINEVSLSPQSFLPLLDDEDSRTAVAGAMQASKKQADSINTAWVTRQGRPFLVAVSYIADMHWYLLTMIDLQASLYLESGWVVALIVVSLMTWLLLFLAFGYAVKKQVLAPLQRLNDATKTVASGNYDVVLPEAGTDEIGTLNRSFQTMAEKLRNHTNELELHVAERTATLRQVQKELEHLAFYDMLTGLANRRAFDERIKTLIDRQHAQQSPFCLLLIDLDEFKSVNDNLGHDVGDALLKEVAIRLTSLVAAPSLVARLGGDEFAILLEQYDSAQAVEALCDDIQHHLQEPIHTANTILRAYASIGIAGFPKHGDSYQQLYKSADIALYAAKKAGRNHWQWSNPAIAQHGIVSDTRAT